LLAVVYVLLCLNCFSMAASAYWSTHCVYTGTTAVTAAVAVATLTCQFWLSQVAEAVIVAMHVFLCGAMAAAVAALFLAMAAAVAWGAVICNVISGQAAVGMSVVGWVQCQ
jgi:hypothetical protein